MNILLHTSGQRGVLQMLHGPLLLVVDQGGHGEGGDGAGAQGQVGVDHSSLLRVSIRGRAAIETGPVDPQKQCSQLQETLLNANTIPYDILLPRRTYWSIYPLPCSCCPAEHQSTAPWTLPDQSRHQTCGQRLCLPRLGSRCTGDQ